MDLLKQPLLVVCWVALAFAAIGVQLFAPTPQLSALAEERVRGVMHGTVSGIGRRSPRGWSLEVRLDALDDRRYAEPPRVRLFVPADHLDAHEAPAWPGDRIEVFARVENYPGRVFPGQRSPREAMASRGVDARATAVEPVAIVGSRIGPIVWVERTLAEGRARFERRLLEGLGGVEEQGDDQQAALAVALTTGNRAFLQPATVAPFRHTGTAHLLAISGLHLGVLAALLWWICSVVVNRFEWVLLRFGRRRACGGAVVLLLGAYVLAIGAPVSAVRAWVMVAVGVTALVLMRPLCPLHALAAAALGLIAHNPAVVIDLGFQLSFSATLGILLFLRFRPPILDAPEDPFAEPEPWARGQLRRVGLFVGVSTSATVATWPSVAAHFGEVATIGLLVNLIVTPLVSAIVFPLLAVGALLSSVVEPLGFAIVELSTGVLLALGDVLVWVAALPGAQWVTGAAPMWATVCLAMGALVAVTSRWTPRRLAWAAATMAIGLSVGLFRPAIAQDGALEVHFIPVGQGDATFVGFPDGTTMLVDAGGSRLGRDPGRFVVVPYLRRLGVRRLDWVIVTHADTDHLGGLFAVVEQMRPRHLVFDARERQESLRELVGRAGRTGTKLHALDGELRRTFGGVTVDIVRPQVAGRSQNDASLVTRVARGPAAVLLPGDVERGAERWLVNHRPVAATVLKVPHHGSRTSSSALFLDTVRPAVAVVSAGRFSRFGHPHAQVLARYRRRGINVLETAHRGLVRVVIGAGGRLEVRTVRP
jgi:competence protein ComEC